MPRTHVAVPPRVVVTHVKGVEHGAAEGAVQGPRGLAAPRREDEAVEARPPCGCTARKHASVAVANISVVFMARFAASRVRDAARCGAPVFV